LVLSRSFRSLTCIFPEGRRNLNSVTSTPTLFDVRQNTSRTCTPCEDRKGASKPAVCARSSGLSIQPKLPGVRPDVVPAQNRQQTHATTGKTSMNPCACCSNDEI
jgi:hypothetical protein